MTKLPVAELEVFLPCQVVSLNEETGHGWRFRQNVRKRVKGDATVLGNTLASVTPPVTIEAHPVMGPRRRLLDAGNAIAVVKPAIDGLVEAGVLPGDGPAVVRWVRFWPGVRGRDEGLRLVIRHDIDEEGAA